MQSTTTEKMTEIVDSCCLLSIFTTQYLYGMMVCRVSFVFCTPQQCAFEEHDVESQGIDTMYGVETSSLVASELAFITV